MELHQYHTTGWTLGYLLGGIRQQATKQSDHQNAWTTSAAAVDNIQIATPHNKQN